MNKYEIVQKIEKFAPPETQEKWDASGWIVEIVGSEIKKILFALTVTPNVIKQAENLGCDMIISHHPLFFVPFEYKKFNIYCAHTNFDLAQGGTTDTLINKLGLKKSYDNGFVRIVNLPNPITVEELKNKLLNISPNLRYVNNYGVEKISSIGFCAGSGAEFINETNVDAFVTGDLKFHTALDADKVVFDIGHFESEIFAPQVLKEITGAGENGVIANEKSPFI
ncbi:Nif3-like dinuclear metal center hexameric protein [bacterium]|nr:Nif3-like dinuclear metal center hexameric protein [bacterium]